MNTIKLKPDETVEFSLLTEDVFCLMGYLHYLDGFKWCRRENCAYCEANISRIARFILPVWRNGRIETLEVGSSVYKQFMQLYDWLQYTRVPLSKWKQLLYRLRGQYVYTKIVPRPYSFKGQMFSMTRTGERLHTKYDVKLKLEVVNYTFDTPQMLEAWEQELREEYDDVS